MKTIVFFGTSEFAVPVLEKLFSHHTVLAVVTQPDKPSGRKMGIFPSPVKKISSKMELDILQPETVSDIKDALLTLSPDFFIISSYGQFIPGPLLKIPKERALNTHPSLLPQYRGATPIQSALLNGDKKTGASILRVTEELDAGEIYAQEPLDICSSITYPDLERRLSHLSAELMLYTLENFSSIIPVKQNPSEVSVCKKIKKEDGEIHWNTESAEQIYNKYRAFVLWPGSSTIMENKKLVITNCQSVPQPEGIHNASPGTVTEWEGRILVQCQENMIELLEIQLSGKNKTDIRSFINGHKNFIGSRLGQ